MKPLAPKSPAPTVRMRTTIFSRLTIAIAVVLAMPFAADVAIAAPDLAAGEPRDAETQAVYRSAHDALKSRDYETALIGFRRVEIDENKRGAPVDAALYWPGLGRLPATELVSEHLLTLADEGLSGLGLRREVRTAYLEVIEQRCRTRQNGSSWQVACTQRFEAAGHDRAEALRLMFAEYVQHMDANTPVSAWPLPEVGAATADDDTGPEGHAS